MKILVIGGVAGGASAAARARRLDPLAEIVILERGRHVSFSNCALPYYIGGIVENSEDLIMMEPEDFRAWHNIEVRTCSEVSGIDPVHKNVMVREVETGREYKEKYDKLIMSPGASPIRPRSIEGIESEHVFTVRNVEDICNLKKALLKPSVKRVTVIGSGFIGLEIVENIKRLGLETSLIESMPQILGAFDYDMVQILHKELADNGVKLYLSSTVTAIEGENVVVQGKETGFSIPSDVVVLAIGVAPEVALAKAAGLELGNTGAIKVNNNYQTSDPDIYAVGDAIEVYHALKHAKTRLNMAGAAQWQARRAAEHIYGIPRTGKGYIGSACLRVFSKNAARTGLSSSEAIRAGYECDSVTVFPMDKVGLMPDSHYMAFKLIFEKTTGKILGAQAIGNGAVDKRVDVIAAMITMHAGVENLKELELCYSPVFGTAKDVVNHAALVASNILEGKLKQVPASKVRELVEQGCYIVDVREEGEFEMGHVRGAHNIPLSQLRERVDEIPQEIPVYLHCRTGQRSYYALRYLWEIGRKNVINIGGSYLGICHYEYFNDKDLGREPIVTRYNFN